MNKRYYYPDDLQRQAQIILWSFRDAAISLGAVLLGLYLLGKFGSLLLLVIAAGYVVLSIRIDSYLTTLRLLVLLVKFFFGQRDWRLRL